MTTRAPAAAKVRAISKPTFRLAPVTTATLPSRRNEYSSRSIT
jgi:hypothetical protein